jgi:UDP-N-acetyl-D-mannosaminuronic acid dehydrogenase
LAFKPNIDDLRESPALEITKMLSDNTKFNILAVEPNVKELPEVLSNRKNVEFSTLDNALENADVVVILVKHKEFMELEKEKFSDKKVVDTTGIVK